MMFQPALRRLWIRAAASGMACSAVKTKLKTGWLLRMISRNCKHWPVGVGGLRSVMNHLGDIVDSRALNAKATFANNLRERSVRLPASLISIQDKPAVFERFDNAAPLAWRFSLYLDRLAGKRILNKIFGYRWDKALSFRGRRVSSSASRMLERKCVLVFQFGFL